MALNGDFEVNHLLLNYPFVPIGILLFLFFGLRCIFSPSDQHRSGVAVLVTIVTIGAGSVALNFAYALSRVRPIKVDLYIYNIDRRLFGVEPYYILAPSLHGHHAVLIGLALCYGLLPIAAILAILVYLYRSPDEFRYIFLLFAINLLAAPLFYLALPVCGPAYAFPDSLRVPDVGTAHGILLTAAPNGIPSVHCSTVLLIVWSLRRWPRDLWLASLYAVAVILATLVYGEHYLLDLVAAVPYAALVCWLANYVSRIITTTKPQQQTVDELATM